MLQNIFNYCDQWNASELGLNFHNSLNTTSASCEKYCVLLQCEEWLCLLTEKSASKLFITLCFHC